MILLAHLLYWAIPWVAGTRWLEGPEGRQRTSSRPLSIGMEGLSMYKWFRGILSDS